MKEEIKKIIEQSSFTTVEGQFIYAKVLEIDNGGGEHFMITRDKEEITVITEIKNLSNLKLIERNKDNYSLISLNVSILFYSVRFLATVSHAVAQMGMNILIVSTYSKDYILVKEDMREAAKEVLLNLGFKEEI